MFWLWFFMMCNVKGCKGGIYLLFYGFPICEKHWGRHCDKSFLKREFKIKEFNNDKVLIDKESKIKKVVDWKNFFL